MKKAVILAGGLGIRLKPFTDVIPKPLLPIGEKALLEIQIEKLEKYGFKEIYIATNYKSEYIESFLGDGSRYNVKLHISKEKSPLGTAGPIKLIQKELNEPFIVMNGDILSLVNFGKMFEFALNYESLLTVGIKRIVTPFSFGNIFFDGDKVTDIQEKPDLISYALAGIYVMKPAILDLIPDNEPYGIDALIKSMLYDSLEITKYEIHDYWIDIGKVDDYKLVADRLIDNLQ
jgi:NDP-sugar pyrophosphorylase family protein